MCCCVATLPCECVRELSASGTLRLSVCLSVWLWKLELHYVSVGRLRGWGRGTSRDQIRSDHVTAMLSVSRSWWVGPSTSSYHAPASSSSSSARNYRQRITCRDEETCLVWARHERACITAWVWLMRPAAAAAAIYAIHGISLGSTWQPRNCLRMNILSSSKG